MAHLLGYARVSTGEQHPDLQVDALTAAGCYRVFIDRASGALAARPALDQVLDQLRPGDTLVVWKLDRLGRSLRHLVDTIAALAERGIGLRSLQEQVDTTTRAASWSFTCSPRWPSSVLSRQAVMLPSPMWGLLPDAVSTGRGRPVCGWSRNVTAALSVESSCSTMRATKSVR
jgi:Resolvase, N terminal domain